MVKTLTTLGIGLTLLALSPRPASATEVAGQTITMDRSSFVT
jgi:hypothetical protein